METVDTKVEEAVRMMPREKLEACANASYKEKLAEARDYLNNIDSYAIAVRKKKEGSEIVQNPEGMLNSYKKSFKRIRRELLSLGIWSEDLDHTYLNSIKKQYLI